VEKEMHEKSLRSSSRLHPVVRRIGLGCELRVLGCDRPKNRRGGGGLRRLGPQTALGRKGKGKGNSFLFSENIFVKNKII
jgi:hypothetical protein